MNIEAAATRGRIMSTGLLALLAVIGFDLFLHAGVLAQLYQQPAPFLLPSEVAFRRIPVGYASFAILIALLVWLVIRLQLAGARRCAALGLILGGANGFPGARAVLDHDCVASPARRVGRRPDRGTRSTQPSPRCRLDSGRVRNMRGPGNRAPERDGVVTTLMTGAAGSGRGW